MIPLIRTTHESIYAIMSVLTSVWRCPLGGDIINYVLYHIQQGSLELLQYYITRMFDCLHAGMRYTNLVTTFSRSEIPT